MMRRDLSTRRGWKFAGNHVGFGVLHKKRGTINLGAIAIIFGGGSIVIKSGWIGAASNRFAGLAPIPTGRVVLRIIRVFAGGGARKQNAKECNQSSLEPNSSSHCYFISSRGLFPLDGYRLKIQKLTTGHCTELVQGAVALNFRRIFKDSVHRKRINARF